MIGADGRLLVVAIDHGLYTWPVAGLEDRETLIHTVASAGADALIASYGTFKQYGAACEDLKRIVKLDLTTLSVGAYMDAPYRLAWTVEDAQRVGADAVLTYVQLGADGELDDLETAARVAAAADRAGVPYVCEIMPIESLRYPDPAAPAAIAAAARTAAELGATIVKTTMPQPASAIADALTAGVPVITAGGDLTRDRDGLLAAVRDAMAAGAAGVAFGRNVWGADDPAAVVRDLRAIIHPPR